jgi:hypothetical protein
MNDTPNHPTLEDLIHDAREYGRDKASGDDSLAKLAHKIVRAAAQGVVDLQKDKHEEGVDDAKLIYTEFAGAKSKKSVHEHTDLGVKANVSKLRQIIKLGVMTTCDPVDVLDRAMTLHSAMVKTDEKVKPAYASYVDVAREQIAHDSPLDDETIKGAMRKKESQEATIESILSGVVKKLEKLITGEAGVKCQDEEIVNAHDMLKQKLAAMILVSERTAKQAELDKLTKELDQMQAAA